MFFFLLLLCSSLSVCMCTDRYRYIYNIRISCVFETRLLMQIECETRTIFMLHLLYLFKNVSRWHLFSQPNYAQKRYVNEVAKRVYTVQSSICFASSSSSFVSLFYVFFLTKIQWEMQKHFPLHEILFISAKYILLSRKFKKTKQKGWMPFI